MYSNWIPNASVNYPWQTPVYNPSPLTYGVPGIYNTNYGSAPWIQQNIVNQNSAPTYAPVYPQWRAPQPYYGGYPMNQNNVTQNSGGLNFRPIIIQNQQNYLPLGARGGINATMMANAGINLYPYAPAM